MSYLSDLEAKPWHFDFFAVLRRLERSFPEHARIGDSAAWRDEYVVLGEDPYLDFPASTLSKAERDVHGRITILVKFLGLLGPQGALPLTTTEEAYSWTLQRDDAFPRFLDIINHRFLQLFFRAWADARPIAQHDRPEADRFMAYIGSFLGVGSAPFRHLDSISDAEKLSFAGLVAPQAKSASRLRSFLSGLLSVDVEIDQFIGSWLNFEEGERTRLGRCYTTLGVDALLGVRVFSVQDKFRVRIFAKDIDAYVRFLPTGDRCELLADAVFLYVGEQLDWDVELAIPVSAVQAMRLGQFGQLGYTSWLGSNAASADQVIRCDARFYPEERLKAKRKQSEYFAA